MQQAKKKITCSLAWRTSIVCLLFLIAPLLVHTFMLYWHEIRLAEADVRSCMKAVGSGLAERLAERIHFDWQILGANCPLTVDIKQMALSGGSPGERFARLNESGDSLLVGIFVLEGEARVLSHPLQEILSLKDAPFPIDIGLSQSALVDQWIERFSLPDTQLTLVLGTSNERIYALERKHFLFRIGTFLGLVVCLGGGLVFFLVQRLAKPLKALSLTMRRVAEGAIHSRYVPQWWGFEINSIGIAFNETLDEMLFHAQKAEEERVKRVRLAEELKVGHEIQKSLLPKKFPLIRDLEISAGSIPAHEVGGDFYDIFRLDFCQGKKAKTLIAVADVAGKGISACLFSLGLRSSLRALATNIDSLSEIVEKANQLFLSDAEESSQFATLWIGIVEKRRLSFVNLGHLPALLKRGEILKELTTENPALGSMRYESVEAGSIDLEEDDEILIFSDGATDAMDADGQRYGIERLKRSFLHCKTRDKADEILNQIQLFSQGAVPHDDLTILFLRVVPIAINI